MTWWLFTWGNALLRPFGLALWLVQDVEGVEADGWVRRRKRGRPYLLLRRARLRSGAFLQD